VNPNGEKAGWIVAAVGWTIAMFRYALSSVFSAGKIFTEVRTVKEEVKQMKETLNTHGVQLGRIEGVLSQMNGKHK
jgi:uncharacterized protein (DUF486 family)